MDSVLVGGAIEARFVASVRGYGSHAGAHLHLGHVIRLLHELDGLLERIWAGEKEGTGRSEVMGNERARLIGSLFGGDLRRRRRISGDDAGGWGTHPWPVPW